MFARFILILLLTLSWSAQGDFDLFMKAGGSSSYEVIFLGHIHAHDGNPGYMGDYIAADRFVSRAGVNGKGVAVLLEGFDRGEAIETRDKILPIISDRVFMTGWEQKDLLSLAWNAFDSRKFITGSDFDSILTRYSMALAFDKASIVYRNRHLIASVEHYGGLGYSRVYVLAGPEHFVHPELMGYLNSKGIRHQIWLDRTYVSSHGGVLGVDSHSDDLEARRRLYEGPLLELGGGDLEEIREMARVGADRILAETIASLGLRIPEPLLPRNHVLRCASFL